MSEFEIRFIDNADGVIAAMEQAAGSLLDEASGEVVSRTVQKSRRRTGQTASGWDYEIGGMVSTIGNPLPNAIWEEYGTGEYALMGNGRRGSWVYRDPVSGNFYRTRGKTPTRAFHHTFTEMESLIPSMAARIFGGLSG